MTIGQLPDIPGVTDLTEIGGGGFGTVYRGRLVRSGESVAVKVLRASVRDKSAQRNFQREEEMLRELGGLNPNIVQLLDSGVLADGQPYLVTEYCDGGSPEPGKPGETELIHIGRIVAEVLRDVHRTGKVHRDVKPNNILFRGRDVVLADFGLAIHIDPDRSRGVDALVPQYAAREILAGGKPTERSDIYSLGATLYCLRMGTPPRPHFPDESDLAYMVRVRDLPPPDLTSFGGPPALRELLGSMLDGEPGQRPSAAEAARRFAALDPTAATAAPGPAHDRTRMRTPGAEQPATPPPANETRVRPGSEGRPAQPTPRSRSRRRPVLVAAAVAGALVVAGAVVAALAAGHSTAQPRTLPSLSAPKSPAPSAAGSPSLAAIVLATPVDHGTSVQLRWTGPAGLQYGVVVGRSTRTPTVTVVGRQRSTRLTVVAGDQYCFVIQGTDGHTTQESNVVSIRGAVCSFR